MAAHSTQAIKKIEDAKSILKRKRDAVFLLIVIDEILDHFLWVSAPHRGMMKCVCFLAPTRPLHSERQVILSGGWVWLAGTICRGSRLI